MPIAEDKAQYRVLRALPLLQTRVRYAINAVIIWFPPMLLYVGVAEAVAGYRQEAAVGDRARIVAV